MTLLCFRARRSTQVQWTDVERRTVWWLISQARNRLGLPLDPVIATAFIILQRFFRNPIEVRCNLMHLITATVLTSCKASNCLREIRDILAELHRIGRCANSRIVQSLFLPVDAPDFITGRELQLVSDAEVVLLMAIDFDYNFEMPFTYVNRWRPLIIARYPEAARADWKMVIIDVCLMVCSAYYLEVPPEVTAAAAACDVLGALDRFDDVIDRYGRDVFNLATQSIVAQKSITRLSVLTPDAVR
jgi:hypothetical protein